MNLAVLGSRIFVKPELNETVTADGLLHLVRDNALSVNQGVVVAVGDGPDDINKAVTAVAAALNREFDRYILDDVLEPGVRATVAHLKQKLGAIVRDARRSHQVVPGDRIIFSPDAGEEVRFEKETLLVMKETDALAVVE